MSRIYTVDQIKDVLRNIDAIRAVEEGFVAFSQGSVVVPHSSELVFDEPPGEIYVKYGNIIGEDYCVIKVWSGFSENISLHLPTSSGLMLVLNQKTGAIEGILLDDGLLTNIRTGAAGAVAAKYLAPKNVHRIGIVGAGTQARMQLEYLTMVVQCRDVTVWGVNSEELARFAADMESFGFNISTTLDVGEIAASCNLIVTATPSKKPLLQAADIQKGTHITAMGAGTPEKTELDPCILAKADIVAADSTSQCLLCGEIHHAKKAGLITEEDVVELGNVITTSRLQRTSEDSITVADLTGIAVQDIQIAVAVFEALTAHETAP